jgi:hypothetical protein
MWAMLAEAIANTAEVMDERFMMILRGQMLHMMCKEPIDAAAQEHSIRG